MAPAAAALAALLTAACIERSNPFDPINTGPVAVVDIRKQDLPALTALLQAGSAFKAFLKEEATRLALDSVYNATVIRENAAVRDSNSRLLRANAAVKEYNLAQTAVDSLRFMSRYAYQFALTLYTLPADFATKRATLQDRLRSASRHMDEVNAAHFPTIVYDAGFISLALQPFVSDTLAFAHWQSFVDTGNAAVRDSNAAVIAYNVERDKDNLAVKDYNESVEWRKQTKDVNVIVRSDSLQAITSAAKAGDTLFLGPGTFNVNLAFTNSGTSDSLIVVRGYPGRATIIRPLANGGSQNSLILTRERKFIRFESLVFRGGVESNVKLEGSASEISFRNCLFDSSQGAGLEAYDSDMELANCEVRANASHGVRVGGSPGKLIRFDNVLIAQNGAAGLQGTSQKLELRNCTFANNGTDGIQLISPSQSIDVTNSVLAWNKRYGINRQPVVDNQEKLAVAQSILFGNGTNWGLGGMEENRIEGLIQDNPIVDPEFIDTLTFNYNPRPGSFLDASENQAVPLVIGYRKSAP
jgi:parallel beta helix pectate lyase-like protein